MAVVSIPTPLRPHTGGLAQVDAQGTTVGEVLADLGTRYPDFHKRIFDGRRAAAVRQRLREQRRHPLPGRPGHRGRGPGRVSIIPAVAGG